MSKITLFGKLHTVCKFTHCELNYTLWVKWHTVYKITHFLWNNTLCNKVLSGVLFVLIVKNYSQLIFFTLALLLMLLTNMRYEAKVIIFCKFLISKFLKGLTHSAMKNWYGFEIQWFTPWKKVWLKLFSMNWTPTHPYALSDPGEKRQAEWKHKIQKWHWLMPYFGI